MGFRSYLKKRFEKNKKTHIFLNEVQQVSNFSKIIDSLFIKKNGDLYVTGSNAYMLSSDLATYIAGRYVQIAMMPLSFKEYTEGTGNDQNPPQKFSEYLEISSFPYTLELPGHPNEIHDYLDALLNTIIVKDIMYKNYFSDPMMLKSVMRFLFDNVGNQLSSKKIADTMTSDGRAIDTKTVEKYISAFIENYVMYQAKRYNPVFDTSRRSKSQKSL